jgi:hypothetical protein
MTSPTPRPTNFIDVNDDVSPYGSAPDTTTLIIVGSVIVGTVAIAGGLCYCGFTPFNLCGAMVLPE